MFTFAMFMILLLLTLFLGSRADCDILGDDAREGLGFDGCKTNSDQARACFTKYLDVVFTNSTEDGKVQHEILTPETFVDRVQKEEMFQVISTSVAAMQCPEVVPPCFPLHTITLTITDEGIPMVKRLKDLKLGDDLVIDYDDSSNEFTTSQIVNFAHRSDADEAAFVRVKTAPGSVFEGSPEHNLFAWKRSPEGEFNEMETTFGSLAQMVVDSKVQGKIEPFFVRGPSIGKVEIESVEFVLTTGFVAPITQNGTMLILAESSQSSSPIENILDVWEMDWIFVSCFSTLPDYYARWVHIIRMIPVHMGLWNANENHDGVGTGYWMNHAAVIGISLGAALGHIAGK